MAMNMRKAFSSKMLSVIFRYEVGEGSYNSDNDFIKGLDTKHKFYGVILAGNKFSQFDEGISRKSTAGGERFSEYKTLYVQSKWPDMSMGDKIDFKGIYYNIIQKSDEKIYGFASYIIEKSKNWQPKLV